MAQLEAHPIIQVYRGTIDEVLRHRDEIPAEAQVELKVLPQETATMQLMRKWLEEDAIDDSEEIHKAEEELLEFKRNMNKPRKEAGMRLLYPEAE